MRTWHSDQRDEGSCRAPKKREIHLELSLCGSLYEQHDKGLGTDNDGSLGETSQ